MRDRVLELRRVRGSKLRAHRLNWRRHPVGQRSALSALFEEVGFAGALLARELGDGSLELIDGHLRAELAAEEEVPVLVLDVDEQEAAKLLALVDPLGDLAEPQGDLLAKLVDEMEVQRESLSVVLAELQGEWKTRRQGFEEPPLPTSYQVVVECEGEVEQRDLFERMRSEGRRCRLLTL